MLELPKNFVVVDVETTGLDPKRHGLLSLGAVIADGRQLYRTCRPHEGCEWDEDALAVNGFTREEVAEHSSQDWEVVRDLLFSLECWEPGVRWIMGGKNPQFDYAFLRQAALREGFGHVWERRVSRRCVDLHSLAYGWAMQNGVGLADDGFSTDLIYDALGLPREPMPHLAWRGARLEMEGFCRILTDGTSGLDLGLEEVAHG